MPSYMVSTMFTTRTATSTNTFITTIQKMYSSRILLILLHLPVELRTLLVLKLSVCRSTTPITNYYVEIATPRGIVSALEIKQLLSSRESVASKVHPKLLMKL